MQREVSLHAGPVEPKQLPRCFFITPNTDPPYASDASDLASEAGSSDYGPEDLMPLLFWPPPAACQAPVTESLDWDIAGPSRRSELYSYPVADAVKEQLFSFVIHYSQIGNNLFGTPSDDSADCKEAAPSAGKMTSVVFSPYRICVLNTGLFSWCYLGLLGDSAAALQSQLQMLHAAITFYLGPLPALVDEFGVKSASHMRDVIQQRLLAAAIDDKHLIASGFCGSFFLGTNCRNPIPFQSIIPTFPWYLHPTTATPTSRLFLEASQILNRFNSSARKDRFVFGGAVFVDTSLPVVGNRSADRNFNLLFTNLDMGITRFLHLEVDRRTPNGTYAQPRWIPASLLLDANIELASVEDEIPLWDSSGHVEASAHRSPLLRSVMQPQNDGIDDVTGFLGTASFSATHTGSPSRRPTTQASLNKKSDGRWIGLFSLECGSVRLVMLVTMRSCNEMHLMERLKRGLTPQVESVARIFDEHRRQDVLAIEQRDEIQRSYQEENEDYHECIWMYDSNLHRELLNHNMTDVTLVIPLAFASTITHIHDMYNRDPGLSRVVARNKAGHVYSRRMFGIQIYMQMFGTMYTDSAIEARLEDSASKIIAEKFGGWI